MKTYIYALVGAILFIVTAGCSIPTTNEPPKADAGADAPCPEAFATCPGDTSECSTNIELADNCGGCGVVCGATQACGVACGVAYGCYTPGGNPVDPGPNDCPSCFRADDNLCGTDASDPITYWCQHGAQPLAGCSTISGPTVPGNPGATWQCCPAPPDGGGSGF